MVRSYQQTVLFPASPHVCHHQLTFIVACSPKSLTTDSPDCLLIWCFVLFAFSLEDYLVTSCYILLAF